MKVHSRNLPGCVLGILILFSAVFAQDSLVFKRLGSIGGLVGPIEEVIIGGDTLVLLGSGCNVEIVTIKQPSRPEKIGQIATNSPVNLISAKGSYVIVCHVNNSFEIYDIHLPASPVRISSYNDAIGMLKLVAIDSCAISLTVNEDVNIFNIADPAKPFLMTSKEGPYRDILARGTYLYAVSDSGLDIIDISNPQKLAPAGHCQFAGSSLGLQIAGNYAYCGMGNMIGVVDISDPAAPGKVADFSVPLMSRRFIVSGQKLCIAMIQGNAQNGFQIYDISDPLHVVFCGQTDTFGFPLQMKGDGDRVLMADESYGLSIINITNPKSPVQEGALYLPGWAVSLSLQGTKICMPADQRTVTLYDISNGLPSISGVCFKPPGNANAVMSGNTVYLSYMEGSTQSRMVIIDAADPAHPLEKGTYYGSGAFVATVAGGYAYLAYGTGPVEIVDISNSDSPALAGKISSTTTMNDIAVSGNRAYIALDENAVQIVDISDPENPKLTARKNVPGSPVGIIIQGNSAYISCPDSGILIADISEPDSLKLFGTVPPPPANTIFCFYYNKGFCVSNDMMFVPCYDQGVKVYDISNPEVPVEIGSCKTSWGAAQVAVAGKYLYVDDVIGGLSTFEMTAFTHEVKSMPEAGNRRYPAAAAVPAGISFTAAHSGPATVALYDCQNRMVRTWREYFRESTPRILPCSHIANGMYIVSATTRAAAWNGKISLTRP